MKLMKVSDSDSEINSLIASTESIMKLCLIVIKRLDSAVSIVVLKQQLDYIEAS